MHRVGRKRTENKHLDTQATKTPWKGCFVKTSKLNGTRPGEAEGLGLPEGEVTEQRH